MGRAPALTDPWPAVGALVAGGYVEAGGGDTGGPTVPSDGPRLHTLISNDGCTSVSEPKGCVREPSW